MARRRDTRLDRAVDRALRALLAAGRLLPYRWRVPFTGWVASRVLSPVAGWPDRIRKNLDHVMPDLPHAERERLVRRVPENAGRAFAEMYSGPEVAARVSADDLEGPGVEALEAAHREGRPVILVTAHFGNYEVPGMALVKRGYKLGALYRPMRNQRFNAHYVAAMESTGKVLFPAGRQGLARLLRHLRDGGMVGILNDVYAKHAPELDFLGKPAPTALSAAELALRHDAPLFPVYGIRKPDGLSFRIVVEAPVARSDPRTMTQALNDSLSARVRETPEQWFWTHRRWKPERQRDRAAATIGP